MKLKMGYTEYWIKDGIDLPSNFDSMNDSEKEDYIYDKKLLHRKDGPAVKSSDGYQWWCLNGLKHRIDGPAEIKPDGTKKWWLNGKLHRVNGPAVIDINGHKYWYLNGKRHRIGGPAIIRSDGTQEWCVDGKRHRIDGPAIIHPNGSKSWYLNGKRHRIDGPAVFNPDGYQYQQWWLNGISVDRNTYQEIQTFSKQELLVYLINPEYRDYLPLIEYRLSLSLEEQINSQNIKIESSVKIDLSDSTELENLFNF